VRRRAVEKLRLSHGSIFEQELGRAIIESLLEAGVDLRYGPGLEEMKQLLVDVLVAAHRSIRPRSGRVLQKA
jgi:hypothetical protein